MSLGRWSLHRVLGRGGMGYVYEATDSQGRQTAVKVLDRILCGEGNHVERFRREAEILGRLDHPNVVRLLDSGEEDGVPYLVLELVVGLERRPVTFDRILSEARMGIPRRLDLFEHALSGLAHAHGRRIVHCDFKPSNVLVGYSKKTGRLHAKLIDFGIASVLGEGGAHLEPGRVAGTARYMSPEQKSRRIGLDVRADVYSAGIFLHEILVGPVPGAQGDGRTRWGSQLPNEYSELFSRATAVRPEGRLLDAESLLREIALARLQWVRELGANERRCLSALHRSRALELESHGLSSEAARHRAVSEFLDSIGSTRSS